ncbi:MAG TPA: alpha/beta fold hydrolase [Patescibacteria group bacterium]|nr:alpha/beta fold hydrolase [Patescibacteria group bacterium]
MKRFIAPALALLLGLAAAGQAVATTMEFDGRQRTFEMYVPPTAPRPLPVVLVLHGGKGTAAQMRAYSHFDRVAARENVIAVYPQAIDGHWNDGRPPGENLRGKARDDNDVDFLLAVADNLIDHGLADPKRVFVAGISNGGMMAIRMACEHAERIAGIAVVAANQPEGLDCGASRPVPAIFFHGTDDRFIPFAGGDILQWGGVDRGRVLSAHDTVEQWRQIDGCTGQPAKTRLSDRNAPTDLAIDKITFEPCSGAPVQHYILRKGGHAWPGAEQSHVGDVLLGPAGTEVDASEEIWSFFKAQPGR